MRPRTLRRQAGAGVGAWCCSLLHVTKKRSKTLRRRRDGRSVRSEGRIFEVHQLEVRCAVRTARIQRLPHSVSRAPLCAVKHPAFSSQVLCVNLNISTSEPAAVCHGLPQLRARAHNACLGVTRQKENMQLQQQLLRCATCSPLLRDNVLHRANSLRAARLM